MRGYPVLGGFSALTVLINSGSVDSVIISPRQLPPERLNNLRVLCAEANVTLSQMTVGLQSLVDTDQSADAARPRPNLRQFPS